MATFNRETTGKEVVQRLSDNIKGKTLLITGPSAGSLGAETALNFAAGEPAHILLLGRTEAKASSVISDIEKISSGTKATFIRVDFASNASVREAAAKINNQVDHIDIMLLTAGVMALKEFQTSEDGIEMQFAANYVGHFLLTCLLIDKVLAAARMGKGPTRIVNMTSEGHTISQVRLDDWNFSDGAAYDPWSGYGQSKTAQILFTVELASRLKSHGIESFAVHPGVILVTGLGSHVEDHQWAEIDPIAVRNTGEHFPGDQPRSIEHGIATGLVASLDPSIAGSSGSYMQDCTIRPTRAYALSKENAEKLWRLSEKLVGEEFDF